MKVHLIKAQTVKKFAVKYAASIQSFGEWIEKVESADWKNMHDIKQTFASADPLGKGSSRVVFDVGGNNYRIICECNFWKTMVHLYVNWIGTHAEYSKLCENDEQYTVETY